MSQSERFYELLDEMKNTHNIKRQDYGVEEDVLANFRTCEMAGIPAFILWYHCVGDMMINFHVKKIAPDYPGGYSSEPKWISPDQWLQFLEHKQAEHFPKCTKQDLFLKKLKTDPRCWNRRAFAPILYK